MGHMAGKRSALDVLEKGPQPLKLSALDVLEEGYQPIANFNEDSGGKGGKGDFRVVNQSLIAREIQNRPLQVQLPDGRNVYLVTKEAPESHSWIDPNECRQMKNLKVRPSADPFMDGTDFIADVVLGGSDCSVSGSAMMSCGIVINYLVEGPDFERGGFRGRC